MKQNNVTEMMNRNEERNEERNEVKNMMERIRKCLDETVIRIRCFANTREEGIDGILVTVGLCIIALLLCVVMKNSLTDFIHSIVTSMTKEASDILKGTRV